VAGSGAVVAGSGAVVAGSVAVVAGSVAVVAVREYEGLPLATRRYRLAAGPPPGNGSAARRVTARRAAG
jgi:hypothetical protein